MGDMNHSIANKFMKVAEELPNSTTYNNFGSDDLYLITTHPKKKAHNRIKQLREIPEGNELYS